MKATRFLLCEGFSVVLKAKANYPISGYLLASLEYIRNLVVKRVRGKNGNEWQNELTQFSSRYQIRVDDSETFSRPGV